MCHNKVEDTFIHNKLHSFAACTWARWIAILDRGVLWLQRKPWQNEVLSPQATAVESQRTSQQYTASVPLCFLYAVLQVFVDLWSGVFEVVRMMMVQWCPSISDPGIEIELETAENDPNGWRLLVHFFSLRTVTYNFHILNAEIPCPCGPARLKDTVPLELEWGTTNCCLTCQPLSAFLRCWCWRIWSSQGLKVPGSPCLWKRDGVWLKVTFLRVWMLRLLVQEIQLSLLWCGDLRTKMARLVPGIPPEWLPLRSVTFVWQLLFQMQKCDPKTCLLNLHSQLPSTFSITFAIIYYMYIPYISNYIPIYI